MALPTRQKEIFTGAAVFAAFFAVFALSYGGEDVPTEDGYQIEAVFNRIDGLAEDADVRMGGVPVGQVVATALDDNFNAVVTIQIAEDIEIPLDSSAAVLTDGLLGGKFIEIEPGGEFDLLENGDSVDFTQGAVVIEELLDLIIAEGKARQAAAKAAKAAEAPADAVQE